MEKSPELARHFEELLKDYWLPTPDGVRFLDPVYKEPLGSSRLPRCVSEHPRLGQGIEFLAARGRDLRLQIIIALHGHPSDFSDIVGYCRDLLEGAPIVGIEADWELQPGNLLPPVRISDHPLRGAFQTAQLAWLNQHCGYVLPCEYCAHSDWTEGSDLLTQRMKRLWMIFENASNNRMRNLAFCAHQSVRRPALFGQFGYWLARLEAAGQLPASITIPLVLGVGHDGSEDYMRRHFGVQAQTRHVPHARLASLPAIGQYTPLFVRMTSEGGATFTQLDTPFGFD